MTPPSNLCQLCDQPASTWVHDSCRRRLDERLAQLPSLYRELGLFLVPARRPDSGITAAAVVASLPINLDALDLRARGGFESLVEWEKDVRDMLGWSPPPFRGTVEQTVTGSAGFLRDNLLWICENHPAIRDLDAEVRGMVQAAMSIVDAPERRGVRLGYCPAVYEDGVICGSVLRLPPGESVVICRWCGATYPPGTWPALASAQDDLDEQEAC